MEVIADFFISFWNELGNTEAYSGLSETDKKIKVKFTVVYLVIVSFFLLWVTRRRKEKRVIGGGSIAIIVLSSMGNAVVSYLGWVLASKLLSLLFLLVVADMVVRNVFRRFLENEKHPEEGKHRKT